MNYLFTFLLIILFQISFARELAKFEMEVGQLKVNSPISVSLEGIDYNENNGVIKLFELNNNEKIEIPCQIETGHSATLWFILGKSGGDSKKTFVIELTTGHNKQQENKLQLEKNHNDLKLTYDGKPILNYRFAITRPPKGVDPLYKRSGFIHPLWSPEGEVLTRIQPPDHYHHYGIWGPWTKTQIGDREVDFWNLVKGEGTVRFAGFLSEEEGAIYSGFKALQQHIDFGTTGEGQIAINELLNVRAWSVDTGIWMVDYTTTINSPLDDGIILNAYRYGGGIGFRATEKWHKGNCSVLTSEGKTRIDADGSFAKWCIVSGDSNTDKRKSGILFMSHPSNRKHPEPMRVWPLDANKDRGDMYFEFVPIRYDDWKIDSKRNYTLKYRMIVFDGKIKADRAENYWKSFASIPKVKFLN